MALISHPLTTSNIPISLSFLTPKPLHRSSTPASIKLKTRFKLRSTANEDKPQQTLDGFSLLELEPLWESSNVWSTMALYFFSLHIPLSFGGLSFVADLLHQPVLDPQLKAVAILVIGTSELVAAVVLLQFMAKPGYTLDMLLKPGKARSDRNWILAALLGFTVLVAAMYLTSVLAGILVGNEDGNITNVKEILLSGSVAQISIALVYCVVAPLLEEIVYRRFLLTSLTPSMQWHQALVLSSLIFAAAHLSGDNFIQLFLIGMVLGSSYSWTGDLRSSILLHSMYNALTLLIDFYT